MCGMCGSYVKAIPHVSMWHTVLVPCNNVFFTQVVDPHNICGSNNVTVKLIVEAKVTDGEARERNSEGSLDAVKLRNLTHSVELVMTYSLVILNKRILDLSSMTHLINCSWTSKSTEYFRCGSTLSKLARKLQYMRQHEIPGVNGFSSESSPANSAPQKFSHSTLSNSLQKTVKDRRSTRRFLNHESVSNHFVTPIVISRFQQQLLWYLSSFS